MNIADIKVKPGDPIRAEQFMVLRDAVVNLLNMRGGTGIQIVRNGGRLSISAIGAIPGYLGIADGDITARAGATPGTGTVDIQWLDDPSIAATGDSVEVKNPGTIISSGKYVWANQDAFGTWWVGPLECE